MQKRYIALMFLGGLVALGSINSQPSKQVTLDAAQAVVDGIDNLGIHDSEYCVATKGVYRNDVALSWRYEHSGYVPEDYQRSQRSIQVNGDLWRKKNCDALGYGPLAPLDTSGKPTWIVDLG